DRGGGREALRRTHRDRPRVRPRLAHRARGRERVAAMRRPDPHADPGTAGSPEDDRERTGESPLDPPSDPFISPSPLPGLFDPPARREERTAPKAPVPTPRAPEAPRTPPWQRHPLAARAAAARTEGPDPARPAPGTRARPLRVSELNRSIQVEIESAFPAVWIVGEISNLSHP